ncbi:TonB-dependent receptor [Brevundimonas diminuta]|uniref:TonB-dependent receptor plug domain-containing protein n=1 Tax=Brevundimonas diminuta TaxID=293 RepID=UPI0020976291|nr:TonB-dependent receptor [Brevundimonas diminuta]MCO8019165.1 TonB-dependent receptor [Brevundimonas diminuta]MCO8021842.1 TonB-dependent receptor [Brevundimonas diminuta]
MTYRNRALASTALMAAFLAPAVVLAQEAPAPTPDAPSIDATSVEAIVVTASRISRSGFEAPTPTKVLSAEVISQRGLTNVGDFLIEVPAFRASQTNQTNPQNSSGAGQNYADLRSLGNIRTLTLVDGRRHVPSSATGQVDLNLIPTVLVDRVDVVTGGASAAWGSDAVSGVVNIVLNRRLDGFRGEASYGISDKGDNADQQFALAFGSPFADGRGHFVIGGEFVDNEGVESYSDRAWGRRQSELVSYTGARPAGTPSRLYADGVQALNMAYGGVIIGPNADTNPSNGVDVLRGIQFGPGGSVIPFDYGDAIGVSAINYTGGNAGLYARDGHQLIMPVKRQSFLTNIDYELSDTLSAFVSVGYGRSGAKFNTPPVRDTATTAIVIKRDNAFLPAEVAAIMDANGIGSFSMGRAHNDFGPVRGNNVNTTERIVAGLEGQLAGDWRWDAYYQVGRNTFDSQLSNHHVKPNFRLAYDAVLDGSGNAVCRDAAARAAGCVALNLFGAGSPSQEAIDYVTGTQFHEVVTKQSVAAVNIQGELLSTWAGAVSVAMGAEYRKEEASATSDKIAQSSGFAYGNPQPFAGEYSAKEAYFETVVPLLRDVAFARSLDFNGAVRYTEYSTSGGVTTWKAGATWEPINDVLIRATQSRDIRAPNNSELFAVTSNNHTLRNPYSGAAAQTRVISQSSPTLQPEESDTTTIGLVYSPSFIPGLQMSVDYYDIQIDGAISGYSPQMVLDNCGNEMSSGAPGFFCGFVDSTGTGAATVIDAVRVELLNIASLSTHGVDFEASYRTPIGAGNLTARLFGNYTAALVSDDGLGTPRTYNSAGVIQNVGSVVDRAGQVGGFQSGATIGATNAPKWTVAGSLTYDRGPMTAMVMGRWVDGGSIDNTLVGPDSPDYDPASPISIANNSIDGKFYTNLSLSYDVRDDGASKVQLYGVVNNLFDVEPPFPATAISGLFDRIGRSYRMGLRFTY